ncbi:3-deoxy-D-manno-octulosonic-acid transferase [Lutimaribacter pacificus]|uniref:3-deoxy-D-manno-octulosonic acid transferase n=1 Tax=Lutimaribacter pacificus TaxID=391948 RepID=A0A1M6MVV7_9RHOB|nr:glycosyltransferase N-terminal domain-containing protein [Lutimaribacter pacificus]SHJ87628.1 3-deoxy-D-manno-octulosonic-acid transferase [Lutimaribacter pacificus]
MSRSLGLAAYLALSARRNAGPYSPAAARGQGRLVWGHAAAAPDARALARLFERLRQVRPDLQFLMTHPAGLTLPDEVTARQPVEPVPAETRDAVLGFLDHWCPDICIWTRGHLRPALIHEAGKRGVAMYLANARDDALEFRSLRWLPDLVRRSLAAFDTVFACDGTVRSRLMRLGLPPDDITVSGPLQEGGSALPCDDATCEELSGALGGRPVWLAARVQPDELPVVTEAHRAALSLAHRLLLVIVPDDAEQETGFAATLDQEGWRVARWARGELPGETTQILLADSGDELGLWYRIAPVSFVGSSIIAGTGGRDPYEPAALGSAILYGPNVSRYLGAYSRLASAGAARMVKDAGTLGAAVTQLIAPDRAAQMAHAAWEVISDGAEVTDRLLSLIEDRLDLLEGGA